MPSNTTPIKKFLVVRFAPGSGGKFLSTLLQCSDSVHAWDDELVQAKQQNDHDKIFNYVVSKFTDDFINWQKIEPEVPYQTDFVSNRFPRGDDITFEQAQELLVNDSKYQHDIHANGSIALILNKSQIPQWLWKKAVVVNIVIDSINSKKWFHRARFAKQFIRFNDSYIVKQEHEDFCSPKRTVLAAKFANEKVYTGSWYSFAKKYIVGDSIGKMFTSPAQIIAHPTNSQVDNLFFNLSNYFNENKFVDEFQHLCDLLNIAPVSADLLLSLVKYYQSLHTAKPTGNNH